MFDTELINYCCAQRHNENENDDDDDDDRALTSLFEKLSRVNDNFVGK